MPISGVGPTNPLDALLQQATSEARNPAPAAEEASKPSNSWAPDTSAKPGELASFEPGKKSEAPSAWSLIGDLAGAAFKGVVADLTKVPVLGNIAHAGLAAANLLQVGKGLLMGGDKAALANDAADLAFHTMGIFDRMKGAHYMEGESAIELRAAAAGLAAKAIGKEIPEEVRDAVPLMAAAYGAGKGLNANGEAPIGANAAYGAGFAGAVVLGKLPDLLGGSKP